MANPTDTRITQTSIVETALRITDASLSADVQRPTGATIGKELGVDRSAIWRHFRHKDDLFEAIADAVIGEAIAEFKPVGDPRVDLTALFDTFYAVILRRPTLASEFACGMFTGPHSSKMADFILDALERLGLTAADAARLYRTYFDLIVSYAAMNAAGILRGAERRQREVGEALIGLAGIDRSTYPHLWAHRVELAEISQDHVTDTLQSAFWLAVQAAIDTRTA